MKYFCTIVSLALLISLSSASAEVPEILNFQGVLTDDAGTVLPDGQYYVTFRLYTQQTAGTPIWQELHLVTVNRGIFNAPLGYTQVLSALDFDEPYYLGISVEGGEELSPRIPLSSAAYSMNSRMVTGSAETENSFPWDGNVGIGTVAPAGKLHVRLDTNSMSPAILIDNRHGIGAQSMIDFDFGGGMNARIRKANGGNLFLETASDGITLRAADENRISILSNGLVGVGTDYPVEILDVAGGVHLGNTSSTNAGTIRWSGTDFEGYDGSSWKSLTAAGGGGLPAGALGNTLYHNGAGWVAGSSLYNNGAQIGIGTTSPAAHLHIYGTGTEIERIESNSSAFSSELELKTSDGTYDYLRLAKYGSSASGNINGIPLADLGLIHTGMSGGPMMIDVMTANPIYFLTNNVERMRLDANGNLGINTKSPGAKLHVDGNQWDLASTEGDFKIGDANYRLKFGVATGGLGAGTANIRVAGGVEKLTLGGGTAEVLSLDGAGNTSIGSSSSNAKLSLYRSGIDSSMLYLGTSNYGGNTYWYDEQHNITIYADADASGTGGFFSVFRKPGNYAFCVDGNNFGTEEPNVLIVGSSRMVNIDLLQSGNASVALPSSAVSSGEIFDEPGVASAKEGTLGISIGTSLTTLASRSITVPAAGYILVMGTAEVDILHTNGTTSSMQIGVSGDNASLPDNQNALVRMPSAAPTGTYALPATVHGLFSASAGTNTYYLLGYSTMDFKFICYNIQLTLMYIPTAYGTVSPTVYADRISADSENAPVRSGLTAAEISAERSESEASNSARIERELASIREEMEALQRRLETIQK